MCPFYRGVRFIEVILHWNGLFGGKNTVSLRTVSVLLHKLILVWAHLKHVYVYFLFFSLFNFSLFSYSWKSIFLKFMNLSELNHGNLKNNGKISFWPITALFNNGSLYHLLRYFYIWLVVYYIWHTCKKENLCCVWQTTLNLKVK